jgi:serine protease Do
LCVPPIAGGCSLQQVEDDPTNSGAEPAYENYVDLVDDSNTITVTVPEQWLDVSGAPIDLGDGQPSPAIVAAPDLAGFNETWSTPGVQFVASSALATLTPDEMLDLLPQDDCTSTGRQAYDDGYFTGVYDIFESCGGTSTRYVQVAALSADGAYGVLVAVQAVADADLEALDVILGSFNVVM